MELQKHQTKICKFVKRNDNKGILLFHGMGTGKTLTSIFILRCILTRDKQAIVLTPKSLVVNYKKELEKSGASEEMKKKVIVMSYTKGIEYLKTHSCKNKILIIDEAHNFKSINSKRLNNVLPCSHKANKVILLSATPIQNNIEEIIPLMMLISNFTKQEIKKMLYGTQAQFSSLFNCNVSHYSRDTNDDNYPKVSVYVKKIEMSRDYYRKYYEVQKNIKGDLPEMFKECGNLTTFYNGIRRAVNIVDIPSDKINFCIKKIESSVKKNTKILVYSNWKDTGVNIIKKYLEKYNILYSIIDGSSSEIERDEQVKKYNDGITKVLLLTSAGGEGLSLKETRDVIILEPHWNEERTNQVIGRAIRYKSHSRLPKEQRKVNVYILLLVKPEDYKIPTDYSSSADEILYYMGKRKIQQIKHFYNRLLPLTIEKNKRCIRKIEI